VAPLSDISDLQIPPLDTVAQLEATVSYALKHPQMSRFLYFVVSGSVISLVVLPGGDPFMVLATDHGETLITHIICTCTALFIFCHTRADIPYCTTMYLDIPVGRKLSIAHLGTYALYVARSLLYIVLYSYRWRLCLVIANPPGPFCIYKLL
jgi:hypothetical protein